MSEVAILTPDYRCASDHGIAVIRAAVEYGEMVPEREDQRQVTVSEIVAAWVFAALSLIGLVVLL